MCELCRRAVCPPRCPNARPRPLPRCPVCGAPAEVFYGDRRGIIGCDACVETLSWETVQAAEEQEDSEEARAWSRTDLP